MKPVKCACCDYFFIPRPNNREKQKYCSAPLVRGKEIESRTKPTVKRKEGSCVQAFEAERQQRIRDRRKELSGKTEARGSSLPAAVPVAHPPDQDPVSKNELAHQDALLGLTSLITGSDSPEEIRIRLARFIEKGKRLRAEYGLNCCVTENST